MYVYLYRKLPKCFQHGSIILYPHCRCMNPSCFTFLPTYSIERFPDFTYLAKCEMEKYVMVSPCGELLLITNDIAYLFMFLYTIHISSSVKCLLKCLVCFYIGLSDFLLPSFGSVLYILEMIRLSDCFSCNFCR